MFATEIGPDTARAAYWLEQGQVVAIPTETVYGLAGNALDGRAVARIFEVKKRPAFDPLIVHVPDARAVEKYAADFPPVARRLAEQFWPGPLTLLLPKKAVIPDLVTSGLERVGLRAPAHAAAQALLRSLAFPLAAPSANPFGYISPTTAQHVYDQLQGAIPYILDGGACTVGVESTIVGLDAQERPVVYRLGGLTLEAIEAVAGSVTVQLNQSSNPAAPGMLKSHYAPRKPLFLGEIARLLPRYAHQRCAVLSFRPIPDLPPDTPRVYLSATGDLAEAAQQLFAALRQLDGSDTDVILAEPAPDTGLGKAINDRLRRAAAK